MGLGNESAAIPRSDAQADDANRTGPCLPLVFPHLNQEGLDVLALVTLQLNYLRAGKQGSRDQHTEVMPISHTAATNSKRM